MKSRMIVAPSVILSYGLNDDQSDKLNQIANKYSITHKPVMQDCLNDKIGYLCGFKSFEKSQTNEIPRCDSQCLVFSGILQKNVSLLLKEFRAVGLNVSLKAIVTPSNQSWSLFELIEELNKEHKYMTERK